MALNTKRAKATQDEIDRVINAGGSVPNSAQKEDKVDKNKVDKNKNIEGDDIRFTVTMPRQLANEIDLLRKPSKTSRQAWLMQAAIDKIDKLKKDERINNQ